MEKTKVERTSLSEEERIELIVVMLKDHRRSKADTIRSLITRAYSAIKYDKKEEYRVEAIKIIEAEDNKQC